MIAILPYKTKLARSFNFTFRYIDDDLSNNSKFGYFDCHIYPIGLEIKDDVDIAMYPSSLAIHLEIDNEDRFRK